MKVNNGRDYVDVGLTAHFNQRIVIDPRIKVAERVVSEDYFEEPQTHWLLEHEATHVLAYILWQQMHYPLDMIAGRYGFHPEQLQKNVVKLTHKMMEDAAFRGHVNRLRLRVLEDYASFNGAKRD